MNFSSNLYVKSVVCVALTPGLNSAGLFTPYPHHSRLHRHPRANNKLTIKSTTVKGTTGRQLKVWISFCVCVLTHVIQLQVGGSAVGEIVAECVDLTGRHLVPDLIIRVIRNIIQGQVERDEQVRPVRLGVRKPSWSYCTGQFERMAFIYC